MWQKIEFKLASKVLRARSESFTESDDTSYASSTNESSEVSTSEATESSCTTTADTTTHLSKATITQVTVPRKIIIKYSSNIETPKVNPPIAIIGTSNSESSDMVTETESEYSEEESDEEFEEEEEVTEETESFTKNETTIAVVTESTESENEGKFTSPIFPFCSMYIVLINTCVSKYPSGLEWFPKFIIMINKICR